MTAGGAVLQGQPDGVNDVENDNSTEHYGANERIPVGAEELADHIVAGGPEDGYAIHQRVKRHE